MGTRYYYYPNPCEHCGRADERLYIGLSSVGWCFALCIHPDLEINDLRDWRRLWAEDKGVIKNEYHDVITVDEMVSTIVDRRGNSPWEEKKWVGYRSEEQFMKFNFGQRGPNNLIRCQLIPDKCIGHGAGTWDIFIGDF